MWVAVVLILGAVGFAFYQARDRVTVRGGAGAEQNLAITRAEAVNMAIAAFVQSRGRANAEQAWDRQATEEGRYILLAPFLAFAPASYFDYMPEGYAIELPARLPTSKVGLRDELGAIVY